MHNVRRIGTLCTVRQRFRVLSSGQKDCLRASAAAGSSHNSRRAALTAALDYARRWCTIETHHLQRKHLATPRREQPRRVLRGCDSPSGITHHVPFIYLPKSVMRNYLIINKRRKTMVPPEGTTDFHKTFSVSSLLITLSRGVGVSHIFNRVVR